MDITLCANYKDCPQKEKCKRAQKTDYEHQSYANFYDKRNCEYFLNNK